MMLFGAETWVLLVTMTQRLEGVHVGFLRQVTKLKGKRLRYGLWLKVVVDTVLQGSGKQPIQNYLEKSKATVAESLDLRHIFDVCIRETTYERGGKLRGPWWIQAAVEKQLRVTLEEILAAAR